MPRSCYVTPKGQTLTFCHALGAGAYGAAMAVKTRKGDTYCLKEIRVSTHDEKAKAEALREVELMKETCDHPNIVSYHDSWFDRHRLYILMEYAPNGSLDAVLAKCRAEGRHLPRYKAEHYLQELASALHYCHDTLRIMHRDIKPANILMDQLGSLKLADFGMSKSLAPGVDMCATFVGTPLFLAPEQCLASPYTFSADVWALGCVLYEIMALHSPWAHPSTGPVPTTMTHLVRRIRECTPPFAGLEARYSAPMVAAVRWMLQKRRHDRPSAAQLVDLLAMRAPPTSLVAALAGHPAHDARHGAEEAAAAAESTTTGTSHSSVLLGDDVGGGGVHPAYHPHPPHAAGAVHGLPPLDATVLLCHDEAGRVAGTEASPYAPAAPREEGGAYYAGGDSAAASLALADDIEARRRRCRALLDAEAAAKIQRSFRESGKPRRVPAPKPRAAPTVAPALSPTKAPAPVLRRPAPRPAPKEPAGAKAAPPPYLHREAPQQDLAAAGAAGAIQKAFRTSLNRRYRPTRKPPLPAPPACTPPVILPPTPRLMQLAAPRVRRAPLRAAPPPVRPCWM